MNDTFASYYERFVNGNDFLDEEWTSIGDTIATLLPLHQAIDRMVNHPEFDLGDYPVKTNYGESSYVYLSELLRTLEQLKV